jgi:hypothetical protein
MAISSVIIILVRRAHHKFYGSHGISQIDHNIIFGWWFIPIKAIPCAYYLVFYGSNETCHENIVPL